MKVRFWGVRGSLPSPITPQQVRNKITAVIQRITVKDLESSDSREKFISNLPEWIYGSVGGNTPCVTLKTDEGTQIVLDAGSGIRVFGNSADLPSDNHYYLFLSHFHWDHIQGLPFFSPVYNPSSIIDIYSHDSNAEQFLRTQQNQPFFPVDFNSFTKNINFHTIRENSPLLLKDIKVFTCKMNHPGGSNSYAFVQNGKKFVYATDVELSQDDFAPTEALESVFRHADVLILDSQYTVEEAYKKEHWGHSAFCYAVDFAVHWGVKRLYLYHHEPAYDDKKLNSILQSARWYAKFVCHSEIKVYLAMENQEFEV